MASSPAPSARATGPGRVPPPLILPRSASFLPAAPSSTTLTASTNAFNWKRSTTVIESVAVAASISASVFVVAVTGLLAELSGLDEVLHLRVHVEAIAIALLQVLGDVQHGVQAEEVGEVEG